MWKTTSLKAKILIIIGVILISVFLSSIISWCLVQIFSRTPEEILNFSLVKVLALLFTSKADLQIFVLLLIIFAIFLIFAVIKLFNLNDYLSKTYKVTPQIEIPLPVGKNQTQHGSAWWLDQKVKDEKFGKFTFDPETENFKNILDYAKENKKEEIKAIEKMENEMKMQDDVKKLDENLSNFEVISDEAYFVNPNTIYDI